MKTTEQLAREVGAFIDVLYACRHDNRVFTSGELETFRRLVIEDYIAGLEPVAWMSPGKELLEFSRPDTVYGSHTIPLYALEAKK